MSGLASHSLSFFIAGANAPMESPPLRDGVILISSPVCGPLLVVAALNADPHLRQFVRG
jgi:hypothetical protein